MSESFIWFLIKRLLNGKYVEETPEGGLQSSLELRLRRGTKKGNKWIEKDANHFQLLLLRSFALPFLTSSYFVVSRLQKTSFDSHSTISKMVCQKGRCYRLLLSHKVLRQCVILLYCFVVVVLLLGQWNSDEFRDPVAMVGHMLSIIVIVVCLYELIVLRATRGEEKHEVGKEENNRNEYILPRCRFLFHKLHNLVARCSEFIEFLA